MSQHPEIFFSVKSNQISDFWILLYPINPLIRRIFARYLSDTGHSKSREKVQSRKLNLWVIVTFCAKCKNANNMTINYLGYHEMVYHFGNFLLFLYLSILVSSSSISTKCVLLQQLILEQELKNMWKQRCSVWPHHKVVDNFSNLLLFSFHCRDCPLLVSTSSS